jgi:hypothetical protein
MPTIRITEIDDNLYEEIKRSAAAENRSVSRQVVFMLKDYVAKRHLLTKITNPGQALLELSGTWKDKRNSEEIVRDIKKARRNSRTLSGGL